MSLIRPLLTPMGWLSAGRRWLLAISPVRAAPEFYALGGLSAAISAAIRAASSVPGRRASASGATVAGSL